ncbi:MAG: hypothetical protein K0S78_3792 [Thermomicrobiales bacterium]|jgi:hypothetical protein|nr:hypothetical protein [Thermomicrobiales bacterium]
MDHGAGRAFRAWDETYILRQEQRISLDQGDEPLVEDLAGNAPPEGPSGIRSSHIAHPHGGP